MLDTWKKSGLRGGDFAALVGLSKHTLYLWKKRFEEEGPGGLMNRPRGRGSGSRLPDLTKRAILILKEANLDYARPHRDIPRRFLVCDALAALCTEHGAWLVVKADNGSREAGIGSLKTRAHEAARHGRSGHWTCDDVQTARSIANECARPRGPCGPTPDEAWRDRIPPTGYDRELLHRTLERVRTEVSDQLDPRASTEPTRARRPQT